MFTIALRNLLVNYWSGNGADFALRIVLSQATYLITYTVVTVIVNSMVGKTDVKMRELKREVRRKKKKKVIALS